MGFLDKGEGPGRPGHGQGRSGHEAGGPTSKSADPYFRDLGVPGLPRGHRPRRPRSIGSPGDDDGDPGPGGPDGVGTSPCRRPPRRPWVPLRRPRLPPGAAASAAALLRGRRGCPPPPAAPAEPAEPVAPPPRLVVAGRYRRRHRPPALTTPHQRSRTGAVITARAGQSSGEGRGWSVGRGAVLPSGHAQESKGRRIRDRGRVGRRGRACTAFTPPDGPVPSPAGTSGRTCAPGCRPILRPPGTRATSGPSPIGPRRLRLDLPADLIPRRAVRPRRVPTSRTCRPVPTGSRPSARSC